MRQARTTGRSDAGTGASLHPVRGTASQLLALLQGWDAADAPAPLVIETSGSTGRPKRVVLSRDAMRASVDATHARLGGPGQWVLNLPPTYVAGVQVLFRSVRAGIPPVQQTGPLQETVEDMAGDRRYLALVPTQLERHLADTDPKQDQGALSALARFDAVLVGGGPLRPRTRQRAEAAGIRVVQTYGMSETCGGCVYDGVPLDGVAVKVDAEGQVLLAGPVLFEGYEGEPDRTADVLRDGWLRTADLGRLDEDGRLQITGRVDDVIISGGVKIPAVAVEQMLLGHPAVHEVVVVGVPDPEWGERVVAVATSVGEPPDLEAIRDAVEPRTWAPRRLAMVTALPRLGNGKVDRVVARRIAADA